MHWIVFLTSRRRQTRWPRDWSSDVCSSDLPRGPQCVLMATTGILTAMTIIGARAGSGPGGPGLRQTQGEIGRASCRERELIKEEALEIKERKKTRSEQMQKRARTRLQAD